MASNSTPSISPPSPLFVDSEAAFNKRKVQSMVGAARRMETAVGKERIGELSEEELNVRLKLLADLVASFNEHHNALERIDLDEIGSPLREEFDECVVMLEIRMKRELNKRQPTMLPCSTMRTDHVGEAPATVIVQSRPRLPELKLPEFSGGYAKYAAFWGMFASIIDKDSDLTNVEKLQHLRSCLKGPALDTISSLEFSHASYPIALDLLNKRFNNKRLIFQAHVTDILGVQRIETSSVSQLRSLSDTVNANLRALQSMGTKDQIADCILIHILLQKVDSATQAKWEECSSMDSIPTSQQFTAFLEQRCQRLETQEHAKEMYTNSNRKHCLVATTFKPIACALCGDTGHSIYRCSQFSNLSPRLRLQEANKLSLCTNCLRSGHQQGECRSRSCRVCGAKHHTLLHFESPSYTSQAILPQLFKSTSTPRIPAIPSVGEHAVTSSATSLLAQSHRRDAVILPTAIISVRSRSGMLIPCRALLDSGSQVHFVTSRLAQQLQIQKKELEVSVSGLGDSCAISEGCYVDIQLESHVSNYAATITALIAPTITGNQPNGILDMNRWNMPSNIPLADQKFNQPQPVDILIGAALFFELLCAGNIKCRTRLPRLQETRLGWIVAGEVSPSLKAAPVSASLFSVSSSEVAPRSTQHRVRHKVRSSGTEDGAEGNNSAAKEGC